LSTIQTGKSVLKTDKGTIGDLVFTAAAAYAWNSPLPTQQSTDSLAVLQMMK